MTGATRRWAYHVLRADGPIETDQLDALGNEGWELVTAVPDRDSIAMILFFKRPAVDFRTRITLDQRASATGSPKEPSQ